MAEVMLTRQALKYIYTNHGDQRVFSIRNHHNVLVRSDRFIWIHMSWVYGHYILFISLFLWTSESDVYRRQILTSKDGPRAERVNPLSAKLFNLNFHPLEVVSRWRDPQLQVSENYSDLTKWRLTVFKYCWFMSHFIFNMFKRCYLMC